MFITGRVKDLFKTSKGKYIEPLVLESYFADITDFEQICVVGLGLPQPICLGVLSEVGIAKSKEQLSKELRTRLDAVNKELPGYKRISTMIIVQEPWTVENGLTTPTLKIKRNKVDQHYQDNYLAWHEEKNQVIFEA